MIDLGGRVRTNPFQFNVLIYGMGLNGPLFSFDTDQCNDVL